jgi:hypothetical protein
MSVKSMQDEEKLSGEPDPEQGIKSERHGDDEALEMDMGEKDEEIYDETGRDKQLEDDEISGAEEGFVEGYSADEVCTACQKILGENPVEREISGKTRLFCSEVCANRG